jgi:hypothetical protein
MDQNPTVAAPLPVTETIRNALQFVWDKRARMLRALAIPAIAIFVLEYLQKYTGQFSEADSPDLYQQAVWSWVYGMIHLFPYILFAITCHRLVLIGNHGIPEYGLLKWTQREWRYMGWSIVIMIFIGLTAFVVTSLFVTRVIRNMDSGVGSETFIPLLGLTYLMYIPILYILSRLSVLYPATAVEEPANLKRAWQLTLNNGWRMTVIVGLLPWVLYFILGLLFRENATIVENIIQKLLQMILLAIEVVALSFSYKHLTKPVTPPASGT